MRLTGVAPPTKQAVNTVLEVLKTKPQGASTKEIFYTSRAPYFLAARRAAERKAKSTSNSAGSQLTKEPTIQSISYLKNTVLKRLHYKGVIEKFHEMRPTKKGEVSGSSKDVRSKAPAAVPMKLAWMWRIKETSSSGASSPSPRSVGAPAVGKS